MFRSSGSSNKKIAAIGTAFAFLLMSCGGESSSSNEGRSKNAKLVDGVCVWNESELAELNAAEAALNLAESEATKWQNDPQFNTASKLLADDPSIEIDGDVFKAAVAADVSSRAAQMLAQEPVRQAAKDAYRAVKNKLDASTSADCQSVKSPADEVFASAVANAKQTYMSSTDPSAAKMIYDAAVSEAARVYKEAVGQYPDQIPALGQDIATDEQIQSTLADLFIDVTWTGSRARVAVMVPTDLDPARFGISYTNCASGKDISAKSQHVAEVTLDEGQSCDFAPYEYATSTNGNWVTVTPNTNPPEPVSVIDDIDAFAGISVVATWTDNLAQVELVFAENVDKSRFGLSNTGCTIDRVLSQWSIEVTLNEGDTCQFSPHEYASRTNGNWVTITAGENITNVESPIEVANAEPYLGAVIYEGNRATVELQIPAGADMTDVVMWLGHPSIDGVSNRPLAFGIDTTSIWIELREGESGFFGVQRGSTPIDETTYEYQAPLAEGTQQYSLFAEVSKVDGVDTLTLSVLDVNGVSVPQILNDWAIDTVGQDYGWIRTDGVTQDISDCCITFKGLEPGREFELVLNQLLNGQWIQVDNKPIKVPGKSRVPLVVVPELDPPSVPLIEAVDALPINVNKVVSQVISADQTEIACSQTCIDSILAKAGVAGEVFVEVDGGGEVLLDGSSTVKLDAQSKDLKISVKPSDGTDAVEFSVALLRQQASSAGSDMSSNSSSRMWIYLLLAVLFIIIVGVVLQRRKSVKA